MARKIFSSTLAVILVLTMMLSAIPAVNAAEDHVAEVNGVGYSSIQEALNSIATGQSATVKVLTDHEVDVNTLTYGYPVLVNGKHVILDLNGKAITFNYDKKTVQNTIWASIAIANGGSLTITNNGTIYNKGTTGIARIVWVNSRSTLIIEDGTFISEQTDTMFYTSSNSSTTEMTRIYIKGGNFEQKSLVTGQNDYDFFNKQDAYASKQVIEVSGGNFNYDFRNGRQNSWEVSIPNEGSHILEDNGDGTWTVHQIECTISFDTNEGTDVAPVTVPYNTSITSLPKSSRDGYRFTGWYKDSELTIPWASTDTVTKDITLYANWVVDLSAELNWLGVLVRRYNTAYPVTATAGEGSSISPAGVTGVYYKRDITYTITPDEGYAIEQVYINGEPAGTDASYTFKKVTGAQSISVSFVKLGEDCPFADTDPTRAALVAYLGALAEVDVTYYAAPALRDVAADAEYAAYVAWAIENKIAAAQADGSFGSDDVLTLDESRTMITAFAAYMGIEANFADCATVCAMIDLLADLIGVR